MNITTVGLDLAKNINHFVGCNQAGKIVKKKILRRSEVLNYFSRLPKCLVGIESCAGAHYWAREIEALGHEVKQVIFLIIYVLFLRRFLVNKWVTGIKLTLEQRQP